MQYYNLCNDLSDSVMTHILYSDKENKYINGVSNNLTNFINYETIKL